MSLNSWFVLRGGHSPSDAAEHDFSVVFRSLRRRLEQRSTMPEQSWRLLDFGCGYHAPLVQAWLETSQEVRGVDVEPCFFQDGRGRLFAERRKTLGLLRATKWATVRYEWYAAYARELRKHLVSPLMSSRLPLDSYDGKRLPYPDGSFDAVYSNAVMEHVDDVALAAAEMSRVTRRQGLIDVVWHNFFSPTGGHRGAQDVARSPWGHVVGEPVGSALNRLPPEEIVRAFSDHMTVLSVQRMDAEYRVEGEPGFRAEGAELLTDAWRSRLGGYTVEELTTRAYVLQGCIEEVAQHA
jgi:SAM-dependent methyltransferase